MSESENKRMRELAGVSIETTEQTAPEKEEEPLPEEMVTTRQTWQQPWIKALIVSSGVLGVVGVLASMSFNAFNVISTSSLKNQATPSSSPTSTFDEKDGETPGQDKSMIALTSQKNELKELNSQTTSSTPTQTPTPTMTALKTPKPTAKPLPTIKIQSNSVPPIPQVIPRKIEHRIIAPSLPTIKSTPLDPMQQWKVAASIGNYSSNGSSRVNSELKPKEITLDLDRGQSNKSISQSQTTDENSRHVLIGSRALGQLQSPVAWSSRGQNQNQNCLIELLSPIKADDDSVALPVGSYIVAKLVNTDESGLVQMSVVSALVDRNEKSIPENSISISGKDGQPLRAKTHKGSSLGGDFAASVLSGVGKGAEIINQPKNQSTITSINGFSSVTSDSQRDIGAGFIQGSTQEMVRRMQLTNERNLQSQANGKVFVVAAKTPVEIFVNQSFNF